MNRQLVLDRVVFWAGAVAAAAYWLVLAWRLELALWGVIEQVASASTGAASVVSAADQMFVLALVFLTYLLPPAVFAVCLRLLHVRGDGRTWAIPATGFALLWLFMGLESVIIGGGPLDLVRVSTFTDAGPTAVAYALLGLAIGSAISWALLAPRRTGAVTLRPERG